MNGQKSSKKNTPAVQNGVTPQPAAKALANVNKTENSTVKMAINSDNPDEIDLIVQSIAREENEKKNNQDTEVWYDCPTDSFLADDTAMEDDTMMEEMSDSDSEEESSSSEEDEADAVEVDMDEENLYFEDAATRQRKLENKKNKERISAQLQAAVALDCEMVGVGTGGVESALARVSIIDIKGATLYDKYVQPVSPVTDYRTRFSGIRPHNLQNAIPFTVAQEEVAAIIKGRLLIGHALKNDFDVLLLSHPSHLIRDTSLYRPFTANGTKCLPSLKKLCHDFLGYNIQEGEHDSVSIYFFIHNSSVFFFFFITVLYLFCCDFTFIELTL